MVVAFAAEATCEAGAWRLVSPGLAAPAGAGGPRCWENGRQFAKHFLVSLPEASMALRSPRAGLAQPSRGARSGG